MDFKKITLNEFTADEADGYYEISHRGVDVPIRYQKGSNQTLVVDFHGAINRDRFTIPKFQAFTPGLGAAHQIRIADPTLTYADDISLGWYLGGHDMPLQSVLTEILAFISSTLSAQRRVYIGGSAGGFAALLFSWQDPGSVCVTVNPQVDLTVYSKNLIGKYVSAAWPGASSISEIADRIIVDLPKIYAQRFENTVIYLQSTGDTKHFERQFPRFLKVAHRHVPKFLLQCSYWGVPDHGNSVPAYAFIPWLKAAVASPTLDRQDILDTYMTITSRPEDVAVSAPTRVHNTSSADDLKFASLLYKHQTKSLGAR